MKSVTVGSSRLARAGSPTKSSIMFVNKILSASKFAPIVIKNKKSFRDAAEKLVVTIYAGTLWIRLEPLCVKVT